MNGELESREPGLQRKHGNSINSVVVDLRRFSCVKPHLCVTIAWRAGNKVFASNDGPLVLQLCAKTLATAKYFVSAS